MSTARSAFTEAIEEHLALKKQNSSLESAMPLARYDVGDPLDRYPGGPNRSADPNTVVVTDAVDGPDADIALDASATAVMTEPTDALVGPSPEQAMEAASALEPGFADRPFEPLNGMAPMLSLVEDIEDDATGTTGEHPIAAEPSSADVLRFPGGVGPREEAPEATDEQASTETPVEPTPAGEQLPMTTQAFSMPSETTPAAPAAGSADETDTEYDAPTGEQPVIVIDTDEPLATSGFDEPFEPAKPSRKKPRFFGLGRKKQQDQNAGDTWFTDGPRDFNWD